MIGISQAYKRKAFLEAELKCARTIGSLEERLRKACHLPNASYESLVKVRCSHCD